MVPAGSTESEVAAAGVNPVVTTEAEQVFRGHCRRMSTTGDGEVDRRGIIFDIIEEAQELEEVRVRVASGDATGSMIAAKMMDVSTISAAMGC